MKETHIAGSHVEDTCAMPSHIASQKPPPTHMLATATYDAGHMHCDVTHYVTKTLVVAGSEAAHGGHMYVL